MNFDVVVGIVGHADVDALPKIKTYFDQLGGFRLVFFKTSSEKLYIREGKENEKIN